MKCKLSCGAVVGGQPEAVAMMIGIDQRMQDKKQEWIQCLRDNGVTAAHPDDGWVNRKTNEVKLLYPQFDDGIDIGVTVALGGPDKHRLVKIISKRDNEEKYPRWGFEAIQ